MAEATGVFLIDGEDAGSTPWEFAYLTQEGTNTIALAAAALNNGSYGYRVAFDGTNEGCYGTYSYTNQTDLYFRFYVRINTGFNTPSDGLVALCSWYAGGSVAARVGILSDGGTTPNTWRLINDWAGSASQTSGFAIGSWVRIEVRLVVHASTGGWQVWVNGTFLEDHLTFNTAGYATNSIRIGNDLAFAVPGSGDSIDFDDLKCDTAYIGAYAAAGGGGSYTLDAWLKDAFIAGTP
jgi:hypothetical protein